MGDKTKDMASAIAERRFTAFISYSHADAGAAAKLQRQLERYSLPKHIARTRATASLGPIFRDREDLAASASLSAAIRDAIARADALIIICSPEAAASHWVKAEIELFRALHPDRPVLAALVSGEPDKAFPSALTADGNEPLAADLRPEGDGPQLGFLKIVAGIAGIPLDALIQRDAQRRIRRVTAITAGALAAMLIMGIMTAYAIQARNEAARQRAEAEGLVEYMLTDLRQKLKGVGRLDVMGAVNERAMEHYRRQASLAELPTDALERRAKLLHLMGEDDDNRGDLKDAAAKFEEAHRTTQALLAGEPENPDRIFSHAQSEYWAGYGGLRAKDYNKARDGFLAYAKLAERLVATDRGNPEWIKETAYAQGNLCTLALMSGADPDSATQPCANSLARMQSVLALLPGDRDVMKDIANRHAWMSDMYERLGAPAKAMAERDRQLDLYARLRAKDPDDADLQELEIGGQIEAARIFGLLGKRREGKALLAIANTALSRLLTLDPANQRWKYLRNRADAIAF
jgi:TolA-binding protein